MPRQPSTTELDRVRRAMSTLIQQRYVWLFSHVSRAVFLDVLDSDRLKEFPGIYFFSEEDQRNGVEPVDVDHIAACLAEGSAIQAIGEDGEEIRYDHEFVREMTLTGIRGSFLVAIQSYLQFFGVEFLVRRYAPQYAELFMFLRQARNIICHANGIMTGKALRDCRWRDVRIKNDGSLLILPDQSILNLVDDAI